MSSITVVGLFGLSNGRRVASENPTTHKHTSHVHYDSTLQTVSEDARDIPVDLRIWSSASEPILADDTVVFCIGRLCIASATAALIDVNVMTPVPGNPADEAYDDAIPTFDAPWIFVTGHTMGKAEKLADGVSVGCFVAASEYVRDQARATKFFCHFDGSRPRWRNIPSPSTGSPVQVMGRAHNLHPTGCLTIDVDQITLNIGTVPPASSALLASPATSPSKRRRFGTKKASPPPVASTSALPGIALTPPPPLEEDAALIILENHAQDVAKGKRGQKRKLPAIEGMPGAN